MKLEKIIKNLLFAGAITAGSLFSTGCATKFGGGTEGFSKSEGFYAGVRPGFGVDLTNYKDNLSAERKYVPVHDSEGGPTAGGVFTSPNTTEGEFSPKLTVEGILGYDRIRLLGGAFARYNGDVDSLDKREGSTRQTSGTGVDSRAYSVFGMDGATTGLYLGAELDLFEWNKGNSKLTIGYEFGTTQSKFKWEKGHDRWNSFEVIEEDSDKANGKIHSIRVGAKIDKNFYAGIRYSKEEYETELMNDKIDVGVGTWGIEFVFTF